MSMICDRVSKTFKTGLGKKDIQAVTDVSFKVSSGEVFGIVGPNGAGKSTLLKMFLGFIAPSSGDIRLFGRSPDNPESRRKLGYLPENPCFYEHLSAMELMQFSAGVSGWEKSRIQKQIPKLLKLMNIAHAKNRRIRSYSKGMVQRAGICFALIHDPDVIILDEPMGGLDPVGRKLLVDLILDLKKQGKTIFFCSHILNDVERLCDRVAIMHLGRLKTILSRRDLIKKVQKTTILVTRVCESVRQACKQEGVEIVSRNNGFQISCAPAKLTPILTALSDNHIEISDIKVSADTLETLFLENIRDKEVFESIH